MMDDDPPLFNICFFFSFQIELLFYEQFKVVVAVQIFDDYPGETSEFDTSTSLLFIATARLILLRTVKRFVFSSRIFCGN